MTNRYGYTDEQRQSFRDNEIARLIAADLCVHCGGSEGEHGEGNECASDPDSYTWCQDPDCLAALELTDDPRALPR